MSSETFQDVSRETQAKIESVPEKWTLRGEGLRKIAKARDLLPPLHPGMIFPIAYPGTQGEYKEEIYGRTLAGSFRVSNSGLRQEHAGVVSMRFEGGEQTFDTALTCTGCLGYTQGSFEKTAVEVNGKRDAKTGEWTLQIGKFSGTVKNLQLVPPPAGEHDVRECTGDLVIRASTLVGEVVLQGKMTLVLAKMSHVHASRARTMERALQHL